MGLPNQNKRGLFDDKTGNNSKVQKVFSANNLSREQETQVKNLVAGQQLSATTLLTSTEAQAIIDDAVAAGLATVGQYDPAVLAAIINNLPQLFEGKLAYPGGAINATFIDSGAIGINVVAQVEAALAVRGVTELSGYDTSYLGLFYIDIIAASATVNTYEPGYVPSAGGADVEVYSIGPASGNPQFLIKNALNQVASTVKAFKGDIVAVGDLRRIEESAGTVNISFKSVGAATNLDDLSISFNVLYRLLAA
jgi:hypothetical protein